MSQDSDLTPQQVKAARALLAWSQQELARSAAIGLSTVADFERGERNPVPNNIGAMRRALEQSGISFLKGGAVAGSKPLGEPRVLRGSPVRLVDSSDIVNWPNRRTCQEMMPELISRLIRASAGPTAPLRFPSGDSIQQANWDGFAEISGPVSDSYIPKGLSGWEIGTQASSIKAKADEDYEKRTAAPLDIDPARATFVFVTPRHWRGKRDWINERKKNGSWADVRALDVDDLVHWIELFPSVGLWLANVLGKRPAGVLEIDEVWKEWSRSTRPALSEDLTTAGRDTQSTAVLKWLYGPPSVLAVRADSPLESAAFLYATVRQLPPDYQKFYLARIVVAGAPEVARMLSASVSPLVIVIDKPDLGLAALIAERGHHVYLATTVSDAHESSVELARPSREQMRHALASMAVDESSAEKLARDSGRSLAVLRRLMPAAPGVTPPKWAEAQYASALLPALFAGGWDESNPGDHEVLERLSGRPYTEWASEVTQWLTSADAPLRKEGAAWKIASPKDAWFRLSPLVPSVLVENYSKIAVEVLSQTDPRFDLKPDDRWMAPVRNQKTKHSGILRSAISETLILMSVFGTQVRSLPDISIHSRSVIHTLLDGADVRRWWSLSGLLEAFAEAAPEEFLDAVDDSLSQDDSPLMGLFAEDGGFFGAAYHSHLLWALEILAWSPRHLARVAGILAKLARNDPGGKFANRPGNSLRNIFLLWLPNTHAYLEQRLRALDNLRKIEPQVAWELMMRLIPTGHDIAEPTARARWRDFSPDQKEVVTFSLLAKAVGEITDRLLQDAGTDPDRWTKMIACFANFPTEKRLSLINCLEAAVAQMGKETARAEVRRSLQSFLHDHRAYPDAKWRLLEADLSGIEKIYRSLEPEDPIDKFEWLFSPQPKLPEPTGKGWEADEALARALRVEALRQIVSKGQDEAFIFAATVEAPVQVGFTLPAVLGDEEKESTILQRALNGSTDVELQIARGMTYALLERGGNDWVGSMLAQAKVSGWNADVVLKFVLTLRPSRFVWDWLRSFEPAVETSYWARVDPTWMEGSTDDSMLAVSKLLSAKRARLAVHLVGHSPKDFPSSLLVQVLLASTEEPWPKNSGNEATMFIYSVEEILLWLDKAGDVSNEELARVEWALLPLLRDSRRPPVALQRSLSTSPQFFVEVVSAIYRPSPDSGIAEEEPGDLDRARAVASQAYQLLRSWSVIPGQVDGAVDSARLEEWVKQARIVCKKAGRLEVGDQSIGGVLACAGPDPDGVWPCVAVRELIEITRSKDLETGISIGVRNRRGVTSRGLTDGGEQERTLAETYRNWSRATELEWPRTSALLERIAASYENEALWHDEDSERNQW